MPKSENYATYRGKPFWAGVVSTLDGTIEQVYSYERCERCDFHHSHIAGDYSDVLHSGEAGYFWLEPDHSIGSAVGFGSAQTELSDAIVGRILDQIKWR